MFKVDLHTHTTASDGQYSPSELVEKAARSGIEYLAVTDHDTLDGVEEAVSAGKRYGISVLRGVELGAREDRHLHILGLGLGSDHAVLDALCRKLKESREERKYRIVDFLREKGVEISLSEVEALASGGVVARPHFARVMFRHGYVSSMEEAFSRYLDTDEYQRIERFKAGAEECIDTIHRSGGLAVLAHPYQLNLPDDKLDAMLSQMKEYGLDGLECYYPRHTPDMVRNYLKMAQKHGLQISAGSDFHGEKVRPDTVLVPKELDIAWLLERS